MDRIKVIKVSILSVLMVVLIVGYYCYLSNKNKNNQSQKNAEQSATEMTDVQELIAKSQYREYPATPVQVLKYYNEITACFYNETYTEDELRQLATMTRELYDFELIANQSFDDYIAQLHADISVFEQGNITIYESEVTPATDVEYFTHDGYECARLNCVYTLKSGTYYQTSKEVYIMRKDENGHWKIMGFALVEEEQ